MTIPEDTLTSVALLGAAIPCCAMELLSNAAALPVEHAVATSVRCVSAQGDPFAFAC